MFPSKISSASRILSLTIIFLHLPRHPLQTNLWLSYEIPVSAIADLVEEEALSSVPHHTKWWCRYNDDSHKCIQKKNIQSCRPISHTPQLHQSPHSVHHPGRSRTFHPCLSRHKNHKARCGFCPKVIQA